MLGLVMKCSLMILIGIIFKCKGQYQFETQYVRCFFPNEPNVRRAFNIREEKITRQMVRSHRLYKLRLQERWELCGAANKHMNLDTMEEDSGESAQMEVNKFFVAATDKSVTESVGLSCPTIPRIVLCLGDENVEEIKTIKILMEKNDFLNKFFVPRDIESIEFVEDSEPEDTILDQKYPCEVLWDICFAARTVIIDRRIIMNSATWWTAVVGIFDIEFPDGKTEKDVVAISCPSSPKMYIRVFPGQFHVLLIDHQRKKESVSSMITEDYWN